MEEWCRTVGELEMKNELLEVVRAEAEKKGDEKKDEEEEDGGRKRGMTIVRRGEGCMNGGGEGVHVGRTKQLTTGYLA